LARPYPRLTGQAEEEALWELKEHSFSQVRRRLGVGYGTLRCLLERRVNQGALEWLEEEGVISLGIDEHSFRHQDMVSTITERLSIPKRIFLVGREKLREEGKHKVDSLLARYPDLRGFYWTKEALRELYQQEDRAVAARHLDNVILNLKAGDDAELVRWGNTLKHWREPILNHFDNGTTNGFTEGCHTKIKMLKRLSYGLRNVDVYAKKMLLGFLPAPICFHTD